MSRKLIVLSGSVDGAPFYRALDTTTVNAATEIGGLVLALTQNAPDGTQTPVNVMVVQLVNG